jgi:NAD(P)H-hydrate repair Nnr-like enzyme with NAD(P)H-hydrate epimerase domain
MKKISEEQMARIDEKVPEEYGITISRMMENAGYLTWSHNTFIETALIYSREFGEAS